LIFLFIGAPLLVAALMPLIGKISKKFLPDLLSNNAILSPTVLLRRSALESIGGFWQPDGVPYLDHPTWLLLTGKSRS